MDTQVFQSRECFKHTLVVSTQAFPSRECFKHALVMNTQALQYRECFQHAFVFRSILTPTVWVESGDLSILSTRKHQFPFRVKVQN